MPFHPSNTYTIDEVNANLKDILNDVEKRALVSLDGQVEYSLKDKIVDGKLYVEQGLLQEIMTIKDLGYADCTVSMQGLGYKQMLAFLNGECTLEEAVYRIKLETRHFAKRQMTWFRREKDCIFFNLSDMSEDDVLQEMARILKEKLIISGECR